jgi:hypothetical protein
MVWPVIASVDYIVWPSKVVGVAHGNGSGGRKVSQPDRIRHDSSRAKLLRYSSRHASMFALDVSANGVVAGEGPGTMWT